MQSIGQRLGLWAQIGAFYQPQAALAIALHNVILASGLVRGQKAQCSQQAGQQSGTPCFAFDVDGVLRQGSEPIPAALSALERIHHPIDKKPKYPFVVMSNGGGVSETERAEQLSQQLKVPIAAEQVILGHTPMQDLLADLGQQPVLVAGRSRSLQVAHEYGFSRAVSTLQLAAAHGAASAPFSDVPSAEELSQQRGLPCPVQDWGAGTAEAPIAAILLFTDPADWYLDLQLCSDVFLGNGILGDPASRVPPAQLSAKLASAVAPRVSSSDNTSDAQPAAERAQHAGADVMQGGDAAPGGNASAVRIIAAQNDLLWSTGYSVPRYGLGAFIAAMRTLVAASAPERCPQVEFFGKPTAAPYKLAERMLDEQAQALGLEPGGTITMVGDNPLSDIAGANAAGERWQSALVRTGVFSGSSNDAEHPGDIVADDVDAAVQSALEQNQSSSWSLFK